MHVTNELFNTIILSIKEEIEKIDYGTIIIKINDSGKYIEISSENRKRIWKESEDGNVHGVEKRYIRED